MAQCPLVNVNFNKTKVAFSPVTRIWPKGYKSLLIMLLVSFIKPKLSMLPALASRLEQQPHLWPPGFMKRTKKAQ